METGRCVYCCENGELTLFEEDEYGELQCATCGAPYDEEYDLEE